MKISCNDTSSSENTIIPSTNSKDDDGVQDSSLPPPPESKEISDEQQRSDLLVTTLDGCLIESKRLEYEPDSSITSADFEPSPTESELVYGSLRLTRSDHENEILGEDLGSPFSDISTKSCVVLEADEESDLSIETHVGIPISLRDRTDSQPQSGVDVQESSQSRLEALFDCLLSDSIPDTHTAPVDATPEKIQVLNAETGSNKPPGSGSLPSVGPSPSYSTSFPDKSTSAHSELHPSVKTAIVPSDIPQTITIPETGPKDVESSVGVPILASAENPPLVKSPELPQPASPPIESPLSISESIIKFEEGVTGATENVTRNSGIGHEDLCTLLIGNDLDDHPSIPVIENDHVLELEKGISNLSNCYSSFKNKLVVDPFSIPLPKSLDSSFSDEVKSGNDEGGEDIVLEDSIKSSKDIQEQKTDENHEFPQDSNKKPVDLKMKFKETEQSSSSEESSDEENFIKPAFDIKMKYKAIDQDYQSPVHPVFERDLSYEIVFREPIPGSAEELRQRVKKPFVLRLFKGKEFDEQVIHSDQDISDTMRRICEDHIDEFEIEELMTDGHYLPTPKSGEFSRDEEEGKMYKTKTMDLFSLLDELRRKSVKYNSTERDEDTLDQETLAAIFADDYARERAQITVHENDENPTVNVIKSPSSSSSNVKSVSPSSISEKPDDVPVKEEEDSLLNLARELVLPLSSDQQNQAQNSQIDLLPAWLGNPPDLNQIQRLIRFVDTLKDLITGQSSVQDSKQK